MAAAAPLPLGMLAVAAAGASSLVTLGCADAVP